MAPPAKVAGRLSERLAHIERDLSPRLSLHSRTALLKVHKYILQQKIKHGRRQVQRGEIRRGTDLRRLRGNGPLRDTIITAHDGVFSAKTGLVKKDHRRGQCLESHYTASEVGFTADEWLWLCVPGSRNPWLNPSGTVRHLTDADDFHDPSVMAEDKARQVTLKGSVDSPLSEQLETWDDQVEDGSPFSTSTSVSDDLMGATFSDNAGLDYLSAYDTSPSTNSLGLYGPLLQSELKVPGSPTAAFPTHLFSKNHDESATENKKAVVHRRTHSSVSPLTLDYDFSSPPLLPSAPLDDDGWSDYFFGPSAGSSQLIPGQLASSSGEASQTPSSAHGAIDPSLPSIAWSQDGNSSLSCTLPTESNSYNNSNSAEHVFASTSYVQTSLEESSATQSLLGGPTVPSVTWADFLGDHVLSQHGINDEDINMESWDAIQTEIAATDWS